MSLFVLVSPGGSPGVTTTALALALAWPREVVLAECDPAGGTVLSGLWRGRPPAAGDGAGLLRYALLAQQDSRAAAASLCEESVPLSARPCRQFVLPAPAAPLAGRQIAAAWPALAAAFAAAPADVIADAGRLDGHTALAPLLAAAGTVLMVCRAADPAGRRRPAPAGDAGRHPRRVPAGRAGPGGGGTLRPQRPPGAQPGAGGPGARQPARRPGRRRRAVRRRGAGPVPPFPADARRRRPGRRPGPRARYRPGCPGPGGRGSMTMTAAPAAAAAWPPPPPGPQLPGGVMTWEEFRAAVREIFRDTAGRLGQAGSREQAAALAAEHVTAWAERQARAGRELPAARMRDVMARAVLDEQFGLGPLQPYADDPEVENIDINGPGPVRVTLRDGRRMACRRSRRATAS